MLCFKSLAVPPKQSFIWFFGGQWSEITSLLLWEFNSFLYLDTAYLEINEEIGTQGASIRIWNTFFFVFSFPALQSCCSPQAAFPAKEVEIRGIQIWGVSLCTAWEAGSCCWFPLVPVEMLEQAEFGTPSSISFEVLCSHMSWNSLLLCFLCMCVHMNAPVLLCCFCECF